jgi:peroxiredoxin
MREDSRSIPYIMKLQALGWLFLATQMVLGANNEAQPSNEKAPDPRYLLKTAAQARNQIASGEMEFEVTSYDFSRPLDGTNHSRCKVVFDGEKKRVESLGREYRKLLTGPNGAAVTDAKRAELGLDLEGAVRAGLLRVFETRQVTIYDGAVCMEYIPADGMTFETSIKNPSDVGLLDMFNPRVLGVNDFPHSTETIESSLGLAPGGSINASLLGKESVAGIPAWHVRLKWPKVNNFEWTVDFWIDSARPYRVLKQENLSRRGVAISQFDAAHPEDPMPTEVTILAVSGAGNGQTTRSETHFIRRSARYNIPVDPVSWTLGGLGMPVGTGVADTRNKAYAYWNGSGLSEDPPPRPQPTAKAQGSPVKAEGLPNPAKLLALMEREPKSAFALEAATWILLNTPDGPGVEKAAALISRNHLRSTNLVYLCQGLARLRHRCARKLLESVLETNPNAEVRAQACFALATLLKSQASEGADEQAVADAERLFERVLTEFGQFESQGRKLADLAEPELSELRRLGVGKQAPEIQGEDLYGQKMKLSDYRGKVVVLTFWGTWCAPCMAMVPDERTLVARLARKPFTLIGVNADNDQNRLKSVLQKERITWPSFRDGSEGPIAKTWNVHSWPAVYVLDPQGVIRYRNVRGQALTDAVDALIREEK